MRPGLKRFGKAVILAAVLAVLFFLGMMLRFRYRQQASWLTVDAPASATAGRPLELKVRLREIPVSGYLVATLHRSGRDRASSGRISSGGSRPLAADAETYTFSIDIPVMAELDFVYAVLYLSPTGGWDDRTRAAYSVPIPVRKPAPVTAEPSWRRLRFFRMYYSPPGVPDSRAPAAPEPQEKSLRTRTPVRISLFILLAASGLLCLTLYKRRHSAGTPGSLQEGRRWMVFAVVLLLAAASEFLLLDEMLTEWGRGIAISSNVYFMRRPVQMAGIAIIAGGGGSLFILSLVSLLRNRALSRLRLAGICLSIYLAVSLVEMLSFHQVDSLKRFVYLGVSIIDWGKGFGAAATLAAVIFALCRDD